MKHILLKKARAYGPDVYLIYCSGQVLVEKTYRNRALPVRIIGILLVFWETFIYSKIQGIPGIPELGNRPDMYTLRTTYLGGENLRDTQKIPDEKYYEHLEELIKKIHEKGVIHLDMRNRRNYGIDNDGMPYLVDFASGLYIPRTGRMKQMLESIDWMGFLKVKERLRPDLIKDEEKKDLSHGKILSNLWLPIKLVRYIKDFMKHIKK